MKDGQSCLLSAHGAPPVVFHGTRARVISRFEPHIRRGEQIGFGIHFAFESSFAREYALNPKVARRGKSPAIMATTVSAKNPLIADQIVYEGSDEFALARRLAGKRMNYPKDELGRRAVYPQYMFRATSPKSPYRGRLRCFNLSRPSFRQQLPTATSRTRRVAA